MFFLMLKKLELYNQQHELINVIYITPFKIKITLWFTTKQSKTQQRSGHPGAFQEIFFTKT